MDPITECLRAFQAEHPKARAPGVKFDRENNQFLLGFKMLPDLTNLWRRHLMNWNPPEYTPETVDTDIEDALEQAYWDFDSKRSKRGTSERDAFKAALRPHLHRLCY